MNILYLHAEGPVSAEMLYDCDVISVPIAITQSLLRVWQEIQPGKFPPVIKIADVDDPWSAWAALSTANYIELWNYGCDVIDEHFHRFGCRSRDVTDKFGLATTLNPNGYRHGSNRMMQLLQSVPPLPAADDPSDPVISVEQARATYKRDGHLTSHTHRPTPDWLN